MPRPRSIYTWIGLVHPRRLKKNAPKTAFLDAVLSRIESRRKLISPQDRKADLMLDTMYQLADRELVLLRRSGYLRRFYGW